jgi:Tol biopolymer transport system component
MMDSDGSNRRQLTDSPAADQSPAVSPDGRYIVFNSTRGGKLNLWRMDSNGENLQQLTSGDLERLPAFSPDGRWVLYDSWNSNPASLWKVAIEGGSPVRLNDRGGSRAVASPDGKLIAYVYSERRQGQQIKVGIIPFEGGAQLKTLDFTPAPPARHDIRWAPDGRSLIYIDAQRGGANLWRLPLDGSPPQPLTDFKDGQIWSFDVTRDGKQFVVARGSNTADVVLISEVK